MNDETKMLNTRCKNILYNIDPEWRKKRDEIRLKVESGELKLKHLRNCGKQSERFIKEWLKVEKWVTRLCKDCVFFAEWDDACWCTHFLNSDLVKGDPVLECCELRHDQKCCGEEGRWFQERKQ